MPQTNPHQVVFIGGINAVAPPHLVGEDEVQAATNVDFSLERGGACVRRGSQLLFNVGTAAVNQIYRHYNKPTDITGCPFFAVVGSGIVRVTDTGTAYSTATILASGATQFTGITSYRQFAYISPPVNSDNLKDDGTTTTEWIKQAPSAALTLAVSTLSPLVVTTSWAVDEGGSSGGTDGTATATTDSSTFRIQFTASLGTSTNLDLNGTSTIGDYGIDILQIKFSNPSNVVRVSRDYSIGGTAFTNYWHTEMDVNLHEFLDLDITGHTEDNAIPDPDVLIYSALNEGTSTDTHIDFETRQKMLAEARQRLRAPKTRISAAKNVFNLWSVPRTKFELITNADSPAGWSNVGAVRIVIEAEGECVVSVTGHKIHGAEDYPIGDAEVGIAYWETFATMETDESGESVVIGESAPSPTSARQKCQGVRMVVTSTNTATGTTHGITHRLWYRQGGYLQDAYAVATTSLATATITDTVNDIQALSANRKLWRNILSRATFPHNAIYASEPHYNRIFVGHLNKIRWSLPGQPDTFPYDSELTVSHKGDEVQGLIIWSPGMIIVNRDSVYELSGNVFEGQNYNANLHRTGARHGSKAPHTVIKTPYGIPILDYDGISMYIPGQGIDVPLDWAMEKMADVFRGNTDYDPAAIKGNRLPALSPGYINESVAAFADDKLYLGLACGANTDPSHLFVLDFRTNQVWVYEYPWTFTSLFWDFQDNRLMAGTSDGKIMRLEIKHWDHDSGGTNTDIVWSVKSRAWTTPADTVLENISVEYKGGPAVVKAIYDNTSTQSIGTLTNTVRDWSTPTMGGTVSNNIYFEVGGTQTAGTATQGYYSAIYAIQWDALLEPKRVSFWRTEHDINQHDGEKIWDVHFADLEIIGTGTVQGTVFVDNTAIMTATYTGPSNGRDLFPTSFPAHTYGDVAYTIYQAQTGILFKHWNTTFDARNEPPRVTVYKSDTESLEENLCDAMDIDIDPNGTVLSTVFVDGTAVGTYTSTGTDYRQSFTHALPGGTGTAPHGLYGRTIYAIHQTSASNFKHYKTWWHLRQEPDRWTQFVSDRRSGNEQFFQTFECDIDCLDATVLATVVLDNTAIATYTMSGNGRQSYPWAVPEDKYGRTIYAVYNCSGGGGKFKFYRDWFEGTEEPDRLSLVQVGPLMYPSSQYLRTWVVDINPLGTCTGLLYVDHVVLKTETFTGTNRTVFNRGLDVNASLALQTAAYEVDIVYHAVGASAKIKHYDTKFETEAKPFGKTTWSITYKKVGGATQLDMARFWSYDIEAQGTATITSIWDVDGTAFTTNTLEVVNRWRDRIAFPPGARGYLFQQRLLSDSGIKVWKSNLDILRTGIKGLSRVTIPGAPAND